MANITTRQTAGTGATVKGSPLTNAEIDTNFLNINTELAGLIVGIQNEGVALTTAVDTLNFVGEGVHAVNSSGLVTVTINSGGSSAGSTLYLNSTQGGF